MFARGLGSRDLAETTDDAAQCTLERSDQRNLERLHHTRRERAERDAIIDAIAEASRRAAFCEGKAVGGDNVVKLKGGRGK